MSDSDSANKFIEEAARNRKILLAISQLQNRIHELEGKKEEPIAIVGMSCRFPGGSKDLQSYWKLLIEGKHGIVEVPRDRWDANEIYDSDPFEPGRIYTKAGGFLKEPIDLFDADFYDMAEAEAEVLDPQQRLALELSWEALEHAGIGPKSLVGTQTGVFLGASSMDFFSTRNALNLGTYSLSGGALSVIAGRVSYFLGLAGPSLVVDTACSSSLVAIHTACRSLTLRESDLALAGGVNLLISPNTTIALCKARMLSTDGLCKTFDASANGYVRGEGCGIIVLKRLSDAQKNGDRILALIRGSAVNQDGASGGLTVPSGSAQVAVIEQALASGNVQPGEVDYVEAHGTGTALGDPIEVRALGQVYGSGRSASFPLVIASAKTNLGHLESAAGIAGIIKVVLSLQNEQIPPHLNFQKLNPMIDLEAIPAVVPIVSRPWTRNATRKRIAGVSGFAFQGTNSHVIIEEASEVKLNSDPKIDRPLHVFCLSGKSPAALAEQGARYLDYLSKSGSKERLSDICFTANAGRTHFKDRLSIVAADEAQLNERLKTFVNEKATKNGVFLKSLEANWEVTKLAFLFSGQGVQFAGMGNEIYKTQPTFRKAFDECNEILRSELPISLTELLWSPAVGKSDLIHQTQYTQPSLFALEYSLSEMWKSWGIEPAAVMGHSVGEYVAAVVAGVFSLEDGLRLIAKRASLMQALPPGGEMAAIALNENEVEELIARFAGDVSIAAINGPRSSVISGSGSAILDILAKIENQEIKVKRLKVSHAFHSKLMEPMLDEFETFAQKISYHAPKIRLISNLTGLPVNDGEMSSARYWRRHIAEPVRFADGMKTLFSIGINTFVEVGPDPVLLGMAFECTPDDGPDSLLLPSLRRTRVDWEQIAESLSRLYINGLGIDWAGFDRDYDRRKVDLPTYPFQRRRYWLNQRL